MGELGAGSGSGYPAVIDTDNSREINAPNPNKTLARAAVFNDENDAIINIETELGTDPAGSLTDMKTFMQTEHNADGSHNIGIWKLKERQEVTVATDTITFSGLDGNTDILYWVFMRVVEGNATPGSEVIYSLRPNNDSLITNYGSQQLSGNNTTVAAIRNTTKSGLYLGSCDDVSYISFFKGLLYAKSGYVRTLNGETSRSITGTTITQTLKIDSVWSNTADNITSLIGYADAANGFGIGTVIEIWRRT